MKVKYLLIALTAIGITVGATAASTINFADPGNVGVDVTTQQASTLTPSSAVLSAELTMLESKYDGAVIYWNYTNTETGTEFKGPVSYADNVGDTVNYTQNQLNKNTQYTFEAYAEPFELGKPDLEDNARERFLNRLSSPEPRAVDQVFSHSSIENLITQNSTAMDAVSSSSTAMDVVSSSSTAMDAVSSSSTAMDAVLGSETAKNSVFTKNTDSVVQVQVSEVDFTPSDHVFIRTKSADNPYDFSASTSVDLATNVNFTGKDTLKIDWVIRSQKSWDDNMEDWARVFVGGNKVLDLEGMNEDATRSIDVSGITGRQNIKVQAYIYDTYSNEYSEQEIEIYNMWLE